MSDSLKSTLATILVVDDTEIVLKSVAAFLESANYRVLTADSGANAIKIAARMQEPIDLLLSDVDMPQMSGPNLGETLKKTRPLMHVMLMSGGTNGKFTCAE